MRRIVVIGSNSFSGSDFIDLLLEREAYEVIGMSRSEEKDALYLPYKRHKKASFRFEKMDFNRDLDKLFRILDDFKPEVIVNFACQSEVAPSWKYPEQWFQTNAVALSKFANTLKDKEYLKRYIHISSPEVYGTCSDIKEDAGVNPSTPYAASRAAGDLFLFTLVKQYQFPLVMIRATNVYGAHQQLFKIIPRTLICAKQKQRVVLHGGGIAQKSYIHIRDVSEAELLAIDKARLGEIYHISPDQSIPIRDLVKTALDRAGYNFDDVVDAGDERPGQDASYRIDSSKARKEFGWSPKITLNDGIDKVIEWIDSNWLKIQREPMEYIHKP